MLDPSCLLCRLEAVMGSRRWPGTRRLSAVGLAILIALSMALVRPPVAVRAASCNTLPPPAGAIQTCSWQGQSNGGGPAENSAFYFMFGGAPSRHHSLLV